MSLRGTQLRSERGQAIVLLTLLLVGLIGMTAVAVDGGQLYYARRSAQSAADNSSLSGAFALCSGAAVVPASLSIASSNGFTNGGSTTVAAYNPPISGPYTGNSDYVEVMIDAEYAPGFAQLVYGGTLEVSARAVSRCQATNGPIGDGNAIISLDPDDDKAFQISGNGSITTNGGGVFVNSNDSNKALSGSGNAEIVSSEGIQVVGGWNTSGNADFSPTPVSGVTPMTDPLATLAAPSKPSGSCTSYSLSGNNTGTISPGLYCSISLSGNSKLTMNPGIYYLSSGGFSTSGNAEVDASGVMFYMEQGSFKISGNGDIDISAPTSGAYAGMMLFMGQTNSSDIKITGNGKVDTNGTIYGKVAELELTGNGSNTTLAAQIIVGTVKVTGNGDLAVNYDSDNLYQGSGSSQVELVE